MRFRHCDRRPPALKESVGRIACALRWLVCCAVLLTGEAASADHESDRFFENSVRPILVERCLECHGDQERSGGLHIASRQSLLKGGDSGPAIVPGDVEGSRIIQAVRRDGDLEMPPDEKLPEREIEVLAQWVKLGAPWPESVSISQAESTDRAKSHWAFQPVRKPNVPNVAGSAWVRTPIDAFVLAKLQAAKLQPSPAADRRTLIRRVSYTLTGLPPSPEEVARFVNDPDPNAYERLVERLLDSPHYGEHWARHWLDVARYSDTKGYVYAREERFWVHAWTYRDWVVRAFNNDLPYDRFLLLQLAADQVKDRSQGDLAAMGYLTLGRRFLGVKHEIIDDRIDVVCRGTMGLTVGCARCHDHKYDPIPTADYYSLYGVFDSCAERMEFVGAAPAGDEAYQKELQTRREQLQTKLAESRAESSARARQRVDDYLKAQTELDKYPAEGFDQIFETDDLLPAFVRRWEAHLRRADREVDPVFVPWHAYRKLPQESFAAQAVEVTQQLQQVASWSINPLVAEAFATAPKSFDEVIERYAALLARIDEQWKAQLAAPAEQPGDAPNGLASPAAEQLRLLLYGPNAPCEVPDEPIVHTESFFTTSTCEALWKLQGEVDRWIINSPVEARYALTLVDRATPVEPRIFRRGKSTNKGPEVPRQFLAALSGPERKPFGHGSGRLELARAIIDPGNPLTARVIVNRVWAHHFGAGLVTTPSDFGLRAAEPSHPELLDWLATRFVEEGWSLKKLHRWILLSATYRQNSAGPDDPQVVGRAKRIDPDNRLLWRMNAHRLTFEEFRDSLLAASGRLDREVRGKPTPLFNEPFPTRRTLYGLVDRQYLPGTLRMFDFANPDLHIPERSETTVPQQALFFLNHPLVLEQTRGLAQSVGEEAKPESTVRGLFQRVLQREPSESELADGLEFLRSAAATESSAPPETVADWKYGYGTFDEEAKQVAGFTPLPHFTGQAWQGGPNWPDSKLGWVQLTATGGHPGNDRQHACIRRWTASRAMTVTIRSKLVHEAAPGDGIRAFVVSSRGGLLQSATIHQKSLELNVDELTVESGETIDFVVDIGDVLNSDQYLWSATISERSNREDATVWDSESDFTRDTVQRLTPTEQLAHVLLCTNEFLFVD